MGWEKRGNKAYYYIKRRRGNKVTSVFAGSGEIAHTLADLAKGRRLENLYNKNRQMEEDEREQEKLNKIETQLKRVDTLIQALTKASLLVTGHHTHKGSWRKKRNGK